MSHAMRVFSIAILIFLGMFTTTAFAASAIPDSTSLADVAKPVLDAVMHGQWMLSAALAIVMLCALAKKYMPASWSTGIKGDVVGIALVFAMSFAGAIATVFAAPGAVWTWAVAYAALKVGVAAAGGYSILHKLASAFAATEWFQTKAPAWFKTVVSYALAIIGSSAVEKAEAAGQAAVDAKPATGMAGADGVKDVP